MPGTRPGMTTVYEGTREFPPALVASKCPNCAAVRLHGRARRSAPDLPEEMSCRISNGCRSRCPRLPMRPDAAVAVMAVEVGMAGVATEVAADAAAAAHISAVAAGMA